MITRVGSDCCGEHVEATNVYVREDLALLALCGHHSGKHGDALRAAGFTPVFLPGVLASAVQDRIDTEVRRGTLVPLPDDTVGYLPKHSLAGEYFRCSVCGGTSLACDPYCQWAGGPEHREW